ncbi:hypothetical protein HMPREF1301_00559 [Propionibacterium sp. KPL2005]|nr:hypothetical protein HMPREF1301_00559 [Propionibacterium sp. KPL2005]ERS29454.1 hypothetical protein HMPREF1297_00268 [Propionibacterium sp. KPL2000]
MTTHKDTTEQQYHRAPLNGLIIGTIVGAVCWQFSQIEYFHGGKKRSLPLVGTSMHWSRRLYSQ